MARRLVVSDGTLAHQAAAYKVALASVVKPIIRACVAANGIVRQYWPVTGSAEDRSIVWTTPGITVHDSVADPANAVASINFSRSLGSCTYKNYPQADVTINYLLPPLDGTAGDDDKYLIRVDQISGTALTGTLATWIDINSAANHTWSLDQGVVGVLNALANITIAQDDGVGSPVAGTEIIKSVTFISEVRATNAIIWSPDQRDLVEIKEAANASCVLTFNPDGYAVGDADTSGSFNEDWHEDSPVVGSPASFTVNATLVSGTAPSGSALGADLTLDDVRSWTLVASSGQNLSCTLDVTVSDGANPITKRITMNSQRTVPATSNDFSATPGWSLTAEHENVASVTLTAKADGTITGISTSEPTLSEDWHSEAPAASDPENYEVYLDILTGDNPTGSIGVWIPLTSDVTWVLAETTWGNIKSATSVIKIRRIGQASVDKDIVWFVFKGPA